MIDEINEKFFKDNIEETPENSWGFIIATYIVYGILLTFIIFVIYERNLIDFIQIKTNHLIHLTLIVSLMLFIVVIILMVMSVGKIKASQIGLQKQKLRHGLLFLALMYIIFNLLLLMLNLMIEGSVNYQPYWNERGVLYTIGFFAGQIYGNVLIEEVYYRGYLIPQLAKKIVRKNPEAKSKSLVFAVTTSSIMFALLHIPIRIYSGVHGVELAWNIFILVGIGVFYALIFVFSNNIFFAMAIHTLGNISLHLFKPIGEGLVLYILSAALILIMHQYQRKKEK